MSTLRIGIVGAGPAGLTAALLLQHHGLAATVYERRSGTAHLPQAHVINTRTSEIFRELGLQEALVAAASPAEKLCAITWRDAVAGTCFGAIRLGRDSETEVPTPAASPELMLNMGQNVLERVLLDELHRRGGTVLFDHEVSGCAVEADKAMLRVRTEDGAERREVFDVVLACDGAGSGVRRALGIAMQGPASLARFASCYFKADLNDFFGEDTGPLHFLGGPDVCGSLVCFDMKDTWALMCVTPPEATPEQFSDTTMLELVRRAIGNPNVEPELVSVSAWNMSAQTAETFRRGPFFLVGDAAHRFPPTGGLGLNTGVQDAHNLAWKLALVAQGITDDALLDTYTPERLPVAARNAQHSMDNAMNLVEVDAAVGAPFLSPVDPDVVTRPPSPLPDYGISGDSSEAVARRRRIAAAIQHQHQHFGALRIELGYRYGEAEWGPDTDLDALPGVAVGARLPHVWVEVDGRRMSTLDLQRKDGYTLLVPAQDGRWDGLAAQLGQRHVTLRHLAGNSVFTEDIQAILVRPDGHVLWHGTNAGTQVPKEIDRLHAGQIQVDAQLTPVVA